MARPFVVVRTELAPDFGDPAVRQALAQKALSSGAEIFGPTHEETPATTLRSAAVDANVVEQLAGDPDFTDAEARAEEARKLAEKLGKRFIVIDSAPGIGCPVVSSLSGADILIVVVEPIPQSLQGARRVLEVAEAFRLRSYLVLNKYDLNEEFSKRIPEELGLEVLGRIPYDEEVVESYTMMNPILLSNPGGRVGKALKEVFENLIELGGLNRHG